MGDDILTFADVAKAACEAQGDGDGGDCDLNVTEMRSALSAIVPQLRRMPAGALASLLLMVGGDE